MIPSLSSFSNKINTLHERYYLPFIIFIKHFVYIQIVYIIVRFTYKTNYTVSG